MKAAILIVVAILAPGAAQAQKGGGFFEVRAHVSAGVDGDIWQLIERVRPELSLEISERVVLTTTVEAALSQGRNLQGELKRTLEESPAGPLLTAAGCTWPEHGNETLAVSSADDYLSVERLYADVYLPAADLRLGRQAVQWGSGFVVNPTDPFPEVLLTQPWRPRAGVNALRATMPIGEDHETQLVVGSNDDFTAVRAAARGTLGLGEHEVSLVGAYRQESDDGLVGLDVRGTLGVGYWVESAIHIDGEGEVFEELVVGIDYSFDVLELLMVTLQYYRNGAGSTDAAGGVASATEIAGPECETPLPFGGDATRGKFDPVFRGRDYAMLSFQLAVLPELSTNALWVQNVGDGTGLVVPTISYAPTGWLTLALAAQVPFSLWGDGGELDPADSDLILTATAPDGSPLTVDFSSLAPAATFTFWSRLAF